MENHNERNKCLICESENLENLLDLEFSVKEYLPKNVHINYCQECDFAFTSPANQTQYTQYYNLTNNDQIHSAVNSSETNHVADIQVNNFRQVLNNSSGLEILDFGCGGGDLIKSLSVIYPGNNYLGFDVNIEVGRRLSGLDEATKDSNCEFINSLEGIEKKFDIIILSHVLEHMVDLDFFSWIQAYLNKDGLVYIEIPNPNEYLNKERREYLYYFDRLHVNHFSLPAVNKLANKYGFKIVAYGNHQLPYKDGKGYPAQYFFCQKSAMSHYSMGGSMKAYILAENEKERSLDKVPLEKPVMVYGFGDNFFRCCSKGGPLFNRKIACVIDRRHKELSEDASYQQFLFLSLEESVKKFPEVPVVVAVSWGTDLIIETIRSMTNSPVYTI